MQEIIAERIAIKPALSGGRAGGGHEGSWRLRRLVRYEREQIRNRQRSIPENLALVSKMHGRKPALSGRWDGGGHEVVRDDEEESLKLIDRWAMDALIPGEKELAILMRGACPETQRREGRLTRELRLDELHLEHMKRQRRERGRSSLSLADSEPESLGHISLPSPLPHIGGGAEVNDLARSLS